MILAQPNVKINRSAVKIIEAYSLNAVLSLKRRQKRESTNSMNIVDILGGN